MKTIQDLIGFLTTFGLQIYSCSEAVRSVSIRHICMDSRYIEPGDVFVAIKGSSYDGHQFIEQAVQKGAVGCIVDSTVFAGKQYKDESVFIAGVASFPDMIAVLTVWLYDLDFNDVNIIGVTGTNGKTTTSLLIQHILAELTKKPVGVMTTVYNNLEEKISLHNTTPDFSWVGRLVYQTNTKAGMSTVVEVSSHALAQNRLGALLFDTVVFTNLSHDHLDYHKTMEDYFQAKLKLWDMLKQQGNTVINIDNPYGVRIYAKWASFIPIITYGLGSEAQLKAYKITLEKHSVAFKMQYGKHVMMVTVPLVGRHAVLNVLAAVGACLIQGFSLEEIVSVLPAFRGVSGRLEYVGKNNKHVYIDYAHTPDALRNVLLSLREIAKGRIFLVFGCGGNRDALKRVVMGRIADELADRVIITSDNPRDEDPSEIASQIAAGITHVPYEVVLDRKRAILQAVHYAISSEDVVLIAGKGHEQYQEINGQMLPFSDKSVVEEYFGERANKTVL